MTDVTRAVGGGDERSRIRAEMRARRRGLPGESRTIAESALTRALIDLVSLLPEYERQGQIAMYLAFDGEPCLNRAFEHLRREGWSVWLPVVTPAAYRTPAHDRDSAGLVFREYREGDAVEPNRFGINEPTTPANGLGAEALDVVVVPSVALDLNGNRLGMGAGYYDRALSSTTGAGTDESSTARPILIGVAFDFQVVDALPAEDWDITMDVVVTDQRVIDLPLR